MMRQDRFTQQAQEVLAASQELVRQQRHSQWDVEHVLLSLLQHPDGLAGKLLERLSVEAGQLRDKVAAHLAETPKLAHDVVQIYTTPRIVGMLEKANAEAERLKDEYVSVEHILIAIADERDGEAARILRIHPQSLRRLIKQKKVPAILFAGKYLIERDKLEMFQANYDPRPGRKPIRRLL